VECLEILGKLLYNCAVTPKEDKFRRIKLTNPRVAATIGAHAPAQEALAALGWVRDAAVPSELVVPDGLYFTMKEVCAWLDAAAGAGWGAPCGVQVCMGCAH
jgi:hypothetical protein